VTTRTHRLALVATLLALPALAQEPRPALLTANAFQSSEPTSIPLGPGTVVLNFAWRFAPGDGAGREALRYDDSGWTPVQPALTAADLSPVGWTGIGWFRRYLQVGPELQGRPLALRFDAQGSARVYLDGHPILAVGEGEIQPEIPARRREAVMIRFTGTPHLLAVRYEYPPSARRPLDGIGFLVSLSIRPNSEPPTNDWQLGLRGAVVALPTILALLHLALFSFDRQRKENLFYALEMLTFAIIVLREYRTVFLPSASRDFIDHLGQCLPIVAIAFGVLTYYALRTHPWPRSWRWFVGSAFVLFPLAWLNSLLAEYLWTAYFIGSIAEVSRLERRKSTVKPEGTAFFLISLTIFGLAIFLQTLVNFHVVESVGGIHEVYIFGILASAIGMSLYLANRLGRSRVVEAENARKTQELHRARELQLSMLPVAMPAVPGLELCAVTQPATEVGGDYYDVKITEEGVLVAFGDATGHGLAAGVVVTAAKALFSSLEPAEPPQDLLTRCDRAMTAMKLPALHMCLALARICPRRVTVVSAGMPPLLLCRATTGEIVELGLGALPLGARLPVLYQAESAELTTGDTLLFASDGFAELWNADGEQLGYPGVTAAFRRAARAGDAKAVVQRLLDEVASFRAGLPQSDDITFLAIRVGPNENGIGSAGTGHSALPV
jgi:serine phosphatase RsbU (regulator of sigma subunit)